MIRKYAFLFIMLFIVLNTNGQVFNTESGKIEILGLKKWNARKLIDSMKALNPNTPIHACAADLRRDFGFTEASVCVYAKDYNDKSTVYYVVTIVENNEKGKIKYLSKPSDSLAVLEQYKAGSSLIKNDFVVFYTALQTYCLFNEGKIDSVKNKLKNNGLSIEKIKPFFEFIQTKKNIEDMNLALWVLENDYNDNNRKIALAILLNFSGYDRVWWAVMNLQRYEDQMFSNFATVVLREFNNNNSRRIDWTPAINSIKYILNGTNLFAFKITLDVLTSTKISPDLSKYLLENSSELIQAYVNAEHEDIRETAVKFIKQISGDDKIKTADDCTAWLQKFI